MAPQEDQKTLHELMLRLRTLTHLNNVPVRKTVKRVKRDAQGFRKRHPKAVTNTALGIGALVTFLLGVFIRRKK